MKALLFTVVLFAAACGGNKASHEPMDPCKDGAGKMAQMDCATMSKNVGRMMEKSGEGGDPAVMESMFADECTTQGWSQETIDCMAAASDEDSGQACMGSMTEAQQQSLDERFDEAERGDGGEGAPEPPEETVD